MEAENPWEFKDTPHFYSAPISLPTQPADIWAELQRPGLMPLPTVLSDEEQDRGPTGRRFSPALSCHSVPRAVKQAEGTWYLRAEESDRACVLHLPNPPGPGGHSAQLVYLRLWDLQLQQLLLPVSSCSWSLQENLRALLLGEGVQASTRAAPQSPEPCGHKLQVYFFLWFVAGSYPAPVLPLPVPCLKHTFLVIPALAPTSAWTCTVS